MSMFDMILPTLLKSINVDEILARPDVARALSQVTQIAEDFRVIREKVEIVEATQVEILRRLDDKPKPVDHDAPL